MKNFLILMTMIASASSLAATATGEVTLTNGSILLRGKAAKKMARELTIPHGQSRGLKFGESYTCSKKSDICSFTIVDLKLGNLVNSSGEVPGLNDPKGKFTVYDGNFADEGFMTIEGHPAQIMFNTLTARSLLPYQRVGERYSCLKLGKRGEKTTYRCEFHIKSKSHGELGQGGVG